MSWKPASKQCLQASIAIVSMCKYNFHRTCKIINYFSSFWIMKFDAYSLNSIKKSISNWHSFVRKLMIKTEFFGCWFSQSRIRFDKSVECLSELMSFNSNADFVILFNIYIKSISLFRHKAKQDQKLKLFAQLIHICLWCVHLLMYNIIIT